MQDPRAVSIIIISHSNSFTLKRATDAITLHSRPIDEKIFVLNNPSQAVKDFACTLGSDWKIITENKPGPQHARNAGAQIAKHGYFLFLDDDTELTEGAIDSLLLRFTDPRIAVTQGYIALEKHPGFFWNYMRLSQINLFKKYKSGALQVCDTAAILVKREWFFAIKGFSPDLRFGEDYYFGKKLTSNGAIIIYDYKKFFYQIYDPAEDLFSFLEKLKKSAPYTLLLRKKLGQPNIIEIPEFNAKNFKWKWIAFYGLNLFLLLYGSLCLNPYRNELHPLRKIQLKANKFRE